MSHPFPDQELADLKKVERSVNEALLECTRGGNPKWPDIHVKLVDAIAAVDNRILEIMAELEAVNSGRSK